MKLDSEISSSDRELTVSVVITTYRNEKYLRNSLESVLRQSYSVLEIIVVDDDPSSNLRDFVQLYNDVRIQYFKMESNHGANYCRNYGTDKATGEVVAFLDDDDEWFPWKLERQLDTFSKGYVASLCSYVFMGGRERRVAEDQGVISISSLHRGNPYCGMSGLVVKRDVISQLKFDERLPCGQDWDIYIRLVLVGEVYYSNLVLFRYRENSYKSITHKAKSITIPEMKDRLRSIEKHRSTIGDINYKYRVATQLLSFIECKNNKLQWFKECVRQAGCITTFKVIFRKTISLIL